MVAPSLQSQVNIPRFIPVLLALGLALVGGTTTRPLAAQGHAGAAAADEWRNRIGAAPLASSPARVATLAERRSATDRLAGFLSQADPWPVIRQARIARLLPEAMRRAEVDAWVVLTRENANDPLAAHVGGENAGGAAAVLFFRIDGGVRSLAISPVGEAMALADLGIHDSVHAIPRGADVYAEVARALTAANPARIAINSSERRPAADGLTYTQRRALEQALGLLSDRLVSSEGLVAEWLSVKLPAEVAILRDAAHHTEALELEAYAAVVPGLTRDADIAHYLKARMRDLGVGDGWSPSQNPNVVSGADRGHSHATDRVITGGDIIQTDFGIRVFDTWVTDIQRFAYVLRPGEERPPAEMERRWQAGRRGNRAAFAAMRPGATGTDVDGAQRAVMREDGSLPVMWSTGHPVGYWAHDVGPALRTSVAAAGQSEVERVLREGQVFAFDGFHSWAYPEGGPGATKTISVEEMVVITSDGAEYLVPPQEELMVIGAVAARPDAELNRDRVEATVTRPESDLRQRR